MVSFYLNTAMFRGYIKKHMNKRLEFIFPVWVLQHPKSKYLYWKPWCWHILRWIVSFHLKTESGIMLLTHSSISLCSGKVCQWDRPSTWADRLQRRSGARLGQWRQSSQRLAASGERGGGVSVLLEWARLMSAVKNAHRQELYNREGEGGEEIQGGRSREEGDIFPLHASSCPHQLKYFRQQCLSGGRRGCP